MMWCSCTCLAPFPFCFFCPFQKLHPWWQRLLKPSKTDSLEDKGAHAQERRELVSSVGELLAGNQRGDQAPPPNPSGRPTAQYCLKLPSGPTLCSHSLASENVKSGCVWKQGSPETVAWPVIYLSPSPCLDDGMERNIPPTPPASL